MRLRDYSDQIPKPLVEIGQRPILWHLMKYYAHFGHTEFILCLGHGADRSRSSSSTTTSGRRTTSCSHDGGQQRGAAQHRHRRLEDHVRRYRPRLELGERLRRVQRHLGDDEMFLANYADGLSDLPLDAVRRHVRRAGQDRLLPHACPVPTLPHRAHRRRRPRDRARAGRHVGGPHQRRLLRAAAGDLRLHEPRRGARPRAVRAADRGAASCSPTRTTGSGGPWTRSRTRSSSTRSPPRATRRGRSGRKHPSDGSTRSTDGANSARIVGSPGSERVVALVAVQRAGEAVGRVGDRRGDERPLAELAESARVEPVRVELDLPVVDQ